MDWGHMRPRLLPFRPPPEGDTWPTLLRALYRANGATLEDLRKAVTTLQDAERKARRVLGGGHPLTGAMERDLLRVRATLRARETPSRG